MSFELKNHQEWLGYVQPVGLVVSAPAMLAAECQVNQNMVPMHRRFMASLPPDEAEEPVPQIPCFATFTQNVLDWRGDDLIEFPLDDIPKDLQSLEVVLDAYNETLRPTHVVPEYKPAEGESPWVMLIQEHKETVDLDTIAEESGRHWAATPQLKFERLLRETNVPLGILTNGKVVRMVYAPKGETSGYITFQVDQMATVAGRPIFAALHMLLEEPRVFSMERSKRLPAVLSNSRKYQNTVSTKLAEQVMGALFELLRGFQAADDQRDGVLLKEILANEPQHIYHGLLNVLMRLVFILYAEDRGLISTDEVYTNHYSISGLFNRLRSDAGRYPDTMDQRYGAWAQLLTLFKLIYDGGQHGDLKIPARDGYLFDPNRYPFLDGRYDDQDVDFYSQKERDSSVQVPRVSDGTVYRILEDLLVLDGERLSYRTLDVEQIGSVYEAIMGFELEVAGGRSIAIKPVKKHGAPATVNLEALLEAKDKDRAKLLKEWADQKITGAALKELKTADSIDGLMNALAKKIDTRVTPQIVPKGAMVFQPSDERRRSGSHYTPRSLTEPIVNTTLEPILKQLTDSEADLPAVWEPTSKDKKERFTKGEIELRIKASERRVKYARAAREVGKPHPSQLLDLKICDPAMGSGAFLVEVCRQLADHLIESWHAHPDAAPSPIGNGANGVIPPDEDEVLYARRLVAQRCLYGVDKNIMAVDLAKLSLWLVTLAKDHAFTFLDHALRHGDTLVGLTREQIIGFHWDVKQQKKFGEDQIQRRLDRATEARAKILAAREDAPYRDQQQRLAVANDALDLIRVLGDACVSCFFAQSKKKAREEEVDRVYGFASSYLSSLAGKKAVNPEESIVSKDTKSKTLISNNQQLATGGVDFASRQALQFASDRLKTAPHPVPAFHWEIEFPEVFARENGGFDAFVGNPPFAGKNTLAKSVHKEFPDWLKQIHTQSHGNADLVAHFFRRTFDLCRSTGTLGLIATNTIGQGDTRSTGLRWIRVNGGVIYSARRRLRWPGQASVMVSVIHIAKQEFDKQVCILDGEIVPVITAYLFHAGTDEDPHPLKQNEDKAFQGPVVLGMGFTFDDVDSSGLASPTSLMNKVIAKNPKCAEKIFPYIGGAEMLNSPTQLHDRFVICFGECSEAEAKEYPQLYTIVESNIKPERMKQKDNADGRRRKKYWWHWGRYTPSFDSAKTKTKRILMHPFTTSNVVFAFVPSSTIIAGPHVGIVLETFDYFAVLQSRIHETWTRFFGSSLKDDLRYTPTDCFAPFPFPTLAADLTQTGEDYYEHRAKITVANNEGLTKTYNRFHDPHEQSEGILELRRLHGLMDGAVLRAYGWDDLADSATCEFLLDYEEEEEDDLGTKKKSKKKKPWRYRWPDDFRDEVLARLLELNEQRHKEELLAGGVIKGKKTVKPKEDKSKKATKEKPAAEKKTTVERSLFDPKLEPRHLSILMLLESWGRARLSRRALNGAVILFHCDSLRKALLGDGEIGRKKKTTNFDLSQTYNELQIDGFINIDNSGAQQLIALTDSAPQTDVSEKDQQRIDEIKQYIENERVSGTATVTEELVDATFDAIPV